MLLDRWIGPRAEIQRTPIDSKPSVFDAPIRQALLGDLTTARDQSDRISFQFRHQHRKIRLRPVDSPLGSNRTYLILRRCGLPTSLIGTLVCLNPQHPTGKNPTTHVHLLSIDLADLYRVTSHTDFRTASQSLQHLQKIAIAPGTIPRSTLSLHCSFVGKEGQPNLPTCPRGNHKTRSETLGS